MKTTRKDRQQPTFETALRRLEQIVEGLERGDVPLEESLRMYEEGIALSRQCSERLQDAELRVTMLNKGLKQAVPEEIDDGPEEEQEPE